MIDTRILRCDLLSEYDIIRLNSMLRQLDSNLEPFTRGGIEALIKSDENIIYLAYQYNLIIGMVTLVRKRTCKNRYHGMLQKFVVDENYRRRKVGETLLLRIIGIARRSGVTELSLVAREHRSEAIRLYESIGFENVGMLTEGLLNYQLQLR